MKIIARFFIIITVAMAPGIFFGLEQPIIYQNYDVSWVVDDNSYIYKASLGLLSEPSIKYSKGVPIPFGRERNSQRSEILQGSPCSICIIYPYPSLRLGSVWGAKIMSYVLDGPAKFINRNIVFINNLILNIFCSLIIYFLLIRRYKFEFVIGIIFIISWNVAYTYTIYDYGAHFLFGLLPLLVAAYLIECKTSKLRALSIGILTSIAFISSSQVLFLCPIYAYLFYEKFKKENYINIFLLIFGSMLVPALILICDYSDFYKVNGLATYIFNQISYKTAVDGLFLDRSFKYKMIWDLSIFNPLFVPICTITLFALLLNIKKANIIKEKIYILIASSTLITIAVIALPIPRATFPYEILIFLLLFVVIWNSRIKALLFIFIALYIINFMIGADRSVNNKIYNLINSTPDSSYVYEIDVKPILLEYRTLIKKGNTSQASMSLALSKSILGTRKDGICTLAMKMSKDGITYLYYKPEIIQDIYLFTHRVKEDKNMIPKEEMPFLYEVFKNSDNLGIVYYKPSYWLDILTSSYGYYLIYSNAFSNMYFNGVKLNFNAYIKIDNLVKNYCNIN